MRKQEEVIIRKNDNWTTEDEPVHRIEFDGVFYDVIGAEITSREAEIFKAAIYAERERVWDESAELVDKKIMNKLLRHDLEFCKECGWYGYLSDVINANARLEYGFKTYPNDLNCPKCNKYILSMSGGGIGNPEGEEYKIISSVIGGTTLNIENELSINSEQKFWYNIGLRYFKQFAEKYPNQSNFFDKDIINEIISSDKDLAIYTKPFTYAYDGVSNVIKEFRISKNISDDDELDVNEIIAFAEKLVHTM
ncbi:hypothetical protein FDB15_17470 [Clostridium botulinum]|nr:hypothetical protein [Clostridium botulinum]NFI64817.1 hypothetical protein [Clostridium botulinum]NFJ45398.1 hypothetical protein [Clostridium botulinum]NFJ49094.1 hypothetical protein [Clostridium botulinum]NFK26978.1 hypothetical protein [Clostridium botulinum]